MKRSRFGYVFLMAMRYLGERKFATWISVAAIGLSVSLVVAVGNINFAIKKTAVEGSIRYPLLIGPEGSSSVQLVFSTIFHIDKPTGTIPFEAYEKLTKDKRVIAAYPLAMADSIKNYPIIGTNQAFLEDLNVGCWTGAVDLSSEQNVVLGNEAAKRAFLKVGDTFHGSHGMIGSEDAHVHKEISYKVVGILNRTEGPEDAAAYTSYQTVWKMHGKQSHTEHQGEEKDKYHLGEGRLTAILVRPSNPVNTSALEREATLTAGTQGVDTGRAIRRMVDYLNKGERIVEVFGAVTLAIAVAMILVTLVMSLSERRKELALMRSLGIGRITIASVIMVEALIITFGGTGAGIIVGHSGVWWAEHLIKDLIGAAVEPWIWTSMETLAVVTTLVAGQLLALISLIWTYRMNLVEEVARD